MAALADDEKKAKQEQVKLLQRHLVQSGNWGEQPLASSTSTDGSSSWTVDWVGTGMANNATYTNAAALTGKL